MLSGYAGINGTENAVWKRQGARKLPRSSLHLCLGAMFVKACLTFAWHTLKEGPQTHLEHIFVLAWKLLGCSSHNVLQLVLKLIGGRLGLWDTCTSQPHAQRAFSVIVHKHIRLT